MALHPTTSLSRVQFAGGNQKTLSRLQASEPQAPILLAACVLSLEFNIARPEGASLPLTSGSLERKLKLRC
jgi:hypothetical protein